MAKWTMVEIELLKNGYAQGVKLSEISTTVGHPEGAVRNKAYRLKITRNTHFTDGEIEYIKKNYTGTNLRQVADILGRSKNYQNVCRVAKRYNLTDKSNAYKNRAGRKTKWTIEQVEMLARLCQKHPHRELSEIIGISEDVVRVKLKELGIKKIPEGKGMWEIYGHPRGMNGKHHNDQFKQKTSARVIKDWEKMTPEKLEKRRIKQVKTRIKNGTLNPNKNISNPYSRTHGGKRPDLGGQYFRSSWEANIARYYNFLGIKWEFEPKEFIFQDLRRGCVSYTPDFYLVEEDKWVEVKGWFDKRSKTKLKRFKKYFPEECAKLEIIDSIRYRAIAKQCKGVIPGWE